MNRRNFLGNLLATAIIASLPKELVAAAANDIDVPGLARQTMKVRLHKDWFQNGDVIHMNNSDMIGQFFLTIDEKTKTGKLFKIEPGMYGEDVLKFDVEFIDGSEATDIIDKAYRLTKEQDNSISSDETVTAFKFGPIELPEPNVIMLDSKPTFVNKLYSTYQLL